MLDVIVHTFHVILGVFTNTVVSPTLKPIGWVEAERAGSLITVRNDQCPVPPAVR